MDTTSEEYRHECEVRTVAHWTREARQRHYEGVAKKRGKEAAQRLCDDVRAYWREVSEGKMAAVKRHIDGVYSQEIQQ